MATAGFLHGGKKTLGIERHRNSVFRGVEMQNHLALLSLLYLNENLKNTVKQNSSCECNLQKKTECQTGEGIIINSISVVLSPS